MELGSDPALELVSELVPDSDSEGEVELSEAGAATGAGGTISKEHEPSDSDLLLLDALRQQATRPAA